jgi:hypothetical protein
MYENEDSLLRYKSVEFSFLLYRYFLFLGKKGKKELYYAQINDKEITKQRASNSNGAWCPIRISVRIRIVPTETFSCLLQSN